MTQLQQTQNHAAASRRKDETADAKAKPAAFESAHVGVGNSIKASFRIAALPNQISAYQKLIDTIQKIRQEKAKARSPLGKPGLDNSRFDQVISASRWPACKQSADRVRRRHLAG